MYNSHEEYQLPPDRIVAFMDILGFRSQVEEMKNDISKYTLIKQVFTENSLILSKPSTNSHLETALFSDSIVISYPIDETSIIAEVQILRFSQYIAAKLLRNGIFVRGGIARGWCHHDGNILFGDGLIKAYDFESQFAKYPRIIISLDIMTRLDKYKKPLTSIIKIDRDGYWFVDPIKLCIGGSPMPPDTINVNLEDCRNHILNGLNYSKTQRPDLINKYQWLVTNFNNTLEQMEEEYKINYLSKYKIEV